VRTHLGLSSKLDDPLLVPEEHFTFPQVLRSDFLPQTNHPGLVSLQPLSQDGLLLANFGQVCLVSFPFRFPRKSSFNLKPVSAKMPNGGKR
jgi:hypothetical protein